MFLVRILLFPLAVLYDLITRVRNHLYNKGLKPAVSFEVPLISVGNLTVGGTGKTPMTEYLIRLLVRAGRVATLSRGYGRKTRGLRIASRSDSAVTLGDEPFQLYTKYADKIAVAVSEDRALAVPFILDRFPDTGAIILDDAFQHRRVIPALNILLSDYNRPFYNDYLLPAGYLRETKTNASRADVVVVTKCPASITDETMLDIEKQIRRYTARPVFFSHIRYGEPVPFAGSSGRLSEKIILITGIADARPLKAYLQDKFKVVRHFEFRDHHAYSVADLEKICRWAEKEHDVSVITTEKDMVKINTATFKPVTAGLPMFYVPIEISFIRNGGDFDALVTTVIKQKQVSAEHSNG